jgi:hypothetical protein
MLPRSSFGAGLDMKSFKYAHFGYGQKEMASPAIAQVLCVKEIIQQHFI